MLPLKHLRPFSVRAQGLLLALVWLLCFGAVHAEERNPLDARFRFDAGWFLMSTDMRVRVDGDANNEVGSDIDFDDTFGIGDFDRFRGEASWRFARRHYVRGMYFENNRRGTREMSRDVEFNGETYPIGATVNATSELAVAQLSYEYAFMQRDDYELAAGLGLHYIDVGLGLAATVSGQGGSASASLDESASTEAPLPVLGLRGLWVLPHNLYLTAQVQYFYIEFDKYAGSLTDLKASLVWQFTDHVGIGVAYNDFGFKVDVDSRAFDGRMRWSYGGAILFASVMF